MKKTLSVIALLLLIIGAVWQYKKGDASRDNHLSHESQSSVTPQYSDEADTKENLPLSNSPEDPDSVPDEIGSSAAITPEYEAWRQERGYYQELPADGAQTIAPTHSYASIDDESLKALADGGDMMAQVVYGDRMLRSLNENDNTEGLKYHEQAAVLGSTYSASAIAMHYLDSVNSKAEDAADGLAWFKVADSRGDAAGAFGLFLRSDNRSYPEALVDKVCERASEIYTNLANQRRNHNLGDFDNEPAPIPDDDLSQLGKFSGSFCD